MATCATSDGNLLVYRPVLRYDIAATMIAARDFSAVSRFNNCAQRCTYASARISYRRRKVKDKMLSYRRGTARRVVPIETVRNVAHMFAELHLISPALRE